MEKVNSFWDIWTISCVNQTEEFPRNVEVVGEGAVAPAAHAAAHAEGRGEDARNQEEGDTAGPA